jgi:hypothetical protein
MAEEPTHVDLGPILAGVIEELGGEIRLSYDSFRKAAGQRAIAIDFEDDGATIKLSLTEEVPSE